MGNNKTNITGSKIQELGIKAGTDKCGILLKEAPSYALIDSQSAKTVSSNENR